MYQALLTRRYLTHKVMPLLAAVAVTLCTAMVLITWSVMGGFLVMLLDTGRRMEGDVSVTWPTVGFAHYEDLIQRLERDPAVAAAAPMIDSFGLVNLPDDRIKGVQIRGIDARFAGVTAYRDSLWWRPISEPLPKDKEGGDPRLQMHPLWEKLYRHGLALEEPDPQTGRPRPAVVLGIELSGFSIRRPEGYYWPAEKVGRRLVEGEMEWMDGAIVGHDVTLNVLPLDRKGRNITVTSRRLPVANEYRTGLFEADKNTVLMNLGELQRMLKMDSAERVVDEPIDPYAIRGEGAEESVATRRTAGVEPARVTTVLVKAADGFTPDQLRERVVAIYEGFAGDFEGQVPAARAMKEAGTITTWRQAHAQFIGAVEKETQLVMGLLVFISFVAVFLILAIFWSMVSEKTKDIGVLRSVGASKAGVAWLWLRYGIAIGVVGAIAGGVFACLIIWNINEIHDWLGRNLELVIWSPEVYYFPEIPSKVDPVQAAVVLVGGVVFSVMGALIPAIKAAWMDPVKALRFE